MQKRSCDQEPWFLIRGSALDPVPQPLYMFAFRAHHVTLSKLALGPPADYNNLATTVDNMMGCSELG